MRIILALLGASLIYADTGWLINNASPRRVASWTVTSAYQNITTMRLEGRITGIVCPSTNGDYKLIGSGSWSGSFPQFGIGLRVNGATCSIWGWNTRDGLAGGEAQAAIPLAGRTDVYFRYQRDPNGGVFVNDSQPRMLFQIWSASNAADKITFNQSSNASIIGTLNQYGSTWSGPFSVGDDFNQIPVGDGTANVAWVKVYDTILGPGADAPKACDPGAFGAWQFEGNANDSSGNGRNLTPTNASYVTTPDITTAAPRTFGAPFWTNMIPFRAGNTNQLDGSTSYSDELTCGMTYQWTQLNAGTAPSVLSWSSRTASQPTVTGAVFGQYDIQLTAVSPAGRTASATVAVGAVATDSNGIVVTDANALALLNSERIKFGASPWPYQDDRQKYMAELFGARQTTRYIARWRTLLTGTVAATNNSTTITGSGTSFNTELDCQTDRSAGDFIAIRYADANVQGGWRYRATKINSCTATSITLEFPWDGPTVSGASFGKFTTQDIGYWIAGGDNANYYDNVLAFYDLYYRSGITQYRDWARELADRFIESPLCDYFGSNGSGGYYYAFAPRVRALSGLMMRALDGRSDFWPLIYSNVFVNRGDSAADAGYGDFYSFGFSISPSGFFNRDPREEAYALAHAAQMSRLYPLDLPNAATRRAALVTHVNHMLANRFAVVKRSDGSQRNYFTDRILGTATVTNGSTAVTGTGFTAAICDSPKTIWFVRSWLDADQDAATYICTYNSSTSITLSTPYSGTSGTKSWTAELINGPPTQPFMQGIVATGFYAAAQALSAGANRTFAETHIADTINWQITYGYRAASKGIYYLRSAANCEPNPDVVQRNGTTWCVAEADDVSATREYAAEILGGFGLASKLDPGNSTILTRGDIHAGAMFGRAGYGGPQTSDGYYGGSLEVSDIRNGKYFGFYFGYGGTTIWPAARLGGIAAEDLRTVRLSYTAPGGTSATSATYIAPSGESSTVSCSGGGCDFPTDWRQGNYLYRLTHTVTNGTVAGDLQPLKVQ